MARIEKDAPVKQELESMKSEIVRNVKKGKKRPHPVLTCAVIALIAFLIFIFWLLWSVAATGLVSIPVLSSIAYQVPEPTRQVIPGETIDSYLQSQINQNTLTLTGSRGEKPTISFQIPEESLTATLQSVVSESASQQFIPDRVQVAVQEGQGLEVFLPLADNDNDSAITMLLVVSTGDSGLMSELEWVRLGSYTMPRWMSNLFVEPIVRAGLLEMNRTLDTYVQIEAIEYKNRMLQLESRLTQDILNMNL